MRWKLKSVLRRSTPLTLMTRPIYLDNHATTRTDPRVVAAMLPYFTEEYGNAGSVNHEFGEAARDAVEAARAAIARSIGAKPREIVFTSGATESNNLAVHGVLQRTRRRGDHVVSTQIEHPSVLEPLARYGRRGFEVELTPPQPVGSLAPGVVNAGRVAEALRDDTALVSCQLASGETGAVQPVAEISSECRARNIPLHCDAAQATGKIDLDVETLGVDLLSLSAHKMYGPKGVGALYVRRGEPRLRIEPQLLGGGQEGGRRSGTINTPGVVALAEALRLCDEERPQETERLRGLRDRLWRLLSSRLPELTLNGPDLEQAGARLAHNLNVSVGGVDGEALLINLREVAASSGSACSSADPEPSYVLLAMGMSRDAARNSLRLGLGRFTTEAEIESAADAIGDAVNRLRRLYGETNPT